MANIGKKPVIILCVRKVPIATFGESHASPPQKKSLASGNSICQIWSIVICTACCFDMGMYRSYVFKEISWFWILLWKAAPEPNTTNTTSTPNALAGNAETSPLLVQSKYQNCTSWREKKGTIPECNPVPCQSWEMRVSEWKTCAGYSGGPTDSLQWRFFCLIEIKILSVFHYP